MFKHLLVASDGSEHALRAAHVAGEIAQKFAAEVSVLCVYDPPRNRVPPVGPHTETLDSDAMARFAEEVLDTVEAKTCRVLSDLGVRYMARREMGHPVEVIVGVAARSNVDLIVLGSRGLGGMESFLLGSVSDRVLHHAHCPVLIVK